MKRQLLMTAAAIALLAGMNAASAQMGGNQQPGAQNAPSGGGTSRGEEKVKPGIHQKEPGAAVQNQQKEKGSTAQSDQRGGSQDKKMGQQGESKEKTGQQGQSKEKVGETKEQTKEKTTQSKDLSKERMGQQSPTGTQQQQGAQPKPGTPQQSAQPQQGTSSSSAKSVALSTEQKSKIQTTIKAQITSQNVTKVTNVNFDIRVGARVPHTVRYYPLPIVIVEIVPEYRGYYFVLVDDEILIIDPNTFEIVAILPA